MEFISAREAAENGEFPNVELLCFVQRTELRMQLW